MVEVQGTAIGAAIQLAIKSFKEERKKQIINIIMDGENHEDDESVRATEAQNGNNH